MSIPSAYARAICSYAGEGGGNWVANWPLNSPRKLGELGTLTNGGFAFERQSYLPFDVDPEVIERRVWEYGDSSESSIEIGTNASIAGWEFIGQAAIGVRASFARSHGVFASVAGSVVERISNVEALKTHAASKARSGDIKLGSAIVVERLVASQALMIISTADDSKLDAISTVGLAGPQAPKASLAGHLRVVRASSGMNLEQYSDAPVVLAFRAVVLTRTGWLWWKKVSAVGFGPSMDAVGLLDAMRVQEDVFASITADRY